MGRVQRPIGINVVMNQTPPSYTENADLVFFSLSLSTRFLFFLFLRLLPTVGRSVWIAECHRGMIDLLSKKLVEGKMGRRTFLLWKEKWNTKKQKDGRRRWSTRQFAAINTEPKRQQRQRNSFHIIQLKRSRYLSPCTAERASPTAG